MSFDERNDKAFEHFQTKYPDEMNELNVSLVRMARALRKEDCIALGSMLYNFDSYVEMLIESGSHVPDTDKFKSMGRRVIMGLVCRTPLMLMASVQPIDEIIGIVYHRHFVETTKVESSSVFPPSEDDSDIASAVLTITSSAVQAQMFTLGRYDMFTVESAVSLIMDAIGDKIMSALEQPKVDVSWNRHQQKGISYFEHKMTLADSLCDLGGFMFKNTGYGQIAYLLAGYEANAVLESMPGFDGLRSQPQVESKYSVRGTYRGIPVIRTAAVSKSEILGVWGGQSHFDTSVIVAPYLMPVLTDTLPSALTSPADKPPQQLAMNVAVKATGVGGSGRLKIEQFEYQY